MKKKTTLPCLLVASVLLPFDAARAEEMLHVVKTDINAESENAEMCVEFDKALAATPASHLASNIRLESNGKNMPTPTLAATSTSLCMFPLERNHPYHLELTGLRGAEDQKMGSAYSQNFTIPDRSPMMAFITPNGSINGFSSFEAPQTLRAVNVAHAKIEIYRITDTASMAHIWQDRAQTALAPSESAYLARNKGQQVWEGDVDFPETRNATSEQTFSLSERMPNLAPGLYLVIADAGSPDTSLVNKGLAPLAAAWFTKSDFSLQAVGDESGVHVFATKSTTSYDNSSIHLAAFNKKSEQVVDAQGNTEGANVLTYPPTLSNKNDVTSVMGIDAAGGVSFTDIAQLPALSSHQALGILTLGDLFAPPNTPIDVTAELAPPLASSPLTEPTLLRLMHGTSVYSDIPIPAFTQGRNKISLLTPSIQGIWLLRWQKQDGTVLAEKNLRVTTNLDEPHLEMSSDHEALDDEGFLPATIKSISASGKPAPLIGGHVSLAWQKMDPSVLGWKDYQFGASPASLDLFTNIGDFLTDPEGKAVIRLALPKPPQERGLYQAVFKVIGHSNDGVADAQPFVLPIKPDTSVIGIKPLAADGRFTQNGLARFALIGLSPEGTPRDLSGLFYQIYEEGRSFTWYQDSGHWQYKPAPQLRPIGGGPLSIKADASSVLEWPVTAGNYHLEIMDPSGKVLAEAAFSAGWDSLGPSPLLSPPLTINLPRSLHVGQEVAAHFDLPEASMVTAFVADAHVRKIIHEMREKGDNQISFTPAADWAPNFGISIETLPQNKSGIVRKGTIEAALVPSKSSVVDEVSGMALVAHENPAALLLYKGQQTTLSFGIENLNDTTESYHYSFVTSAGLKIQGEESGNFTLGGKQSRPVSVTVSADLLGAKDLRLDVTGFHTPHTTHSWTMDVLSPIPVHSRTTTIIEPRQTLLEKTRPGSEDIIALASRRPTDGLVEILSYLFNAQPFTSSELALSVDALRLWEPLMAQVGIAPESLIAARRQEQIASLLRHQNSDGGFSALRNGDSTMEDTSAALLALGPDTTDQVKPARALAINWIKQRLANTWFGEKDREPRAAAYAALAAADAIDPASLHYFSDTSATSPLSALADIHMAAAFKQQRDPNAAAFWIKKMLDEKGRSHDISEMNALAETDALSSDDVVAATKVMRDNLKQGQTPEIQDAAALLRALFVDAQNAGRFRITTGADTSSVSGILVLHSSQPTSPVANSDPQSLSVTTLTTAVVPTPTQGNDPLLTRRVYRLNGVELTPPAKPLHNETYIVELKGSLPASTDNGQILLQEGGNAAGIRPVGCPLSAKLETPAFMPWFSTRQLTPFTACELGAHGWGLVLAPTDSESTTFSSVYFAHMDAPSLAEIPTARLRILH